VTPTNFEKIELISIPKDIVAIRKNDLKEALKLRLEVRNQFRSLLDNGYQVVGFTENSEYKLSK
jgi:predicted GNAT superfamily acetyltransferase